MLIVALYYLILNHNPATSVQANILFSWVRIRSDYFFFIRNEIMSLDFFWRRKLVDLHDISQKGLWCISLMVALGIIANFFLKS